MREAIARAEVGDEQIGDDPTVNLLCERVADLLGKEAAVFMPSGTMCNVAATLVHCRPGDEILAHATAHIIAREGGAHAALGGFQITPLPGADGQFSPDTLSRRAAPAQPLPAAADASSASSRPPISAAARSGRRPTSTKSSKIAKANGLATHMDGARLLNACVATGIAARDMADGWDSAWIDFSKGLGAPIGGAIAGIARFHRRGLALEAAPRRLDAPGRHLRRGSASTRSTITSTAWPTITPMPGRWRAGCRRSTASRCSSPKPTWCSSSPTAPASAARKWSQALRQRGVLLAMMDGRIRACTHLDVTR